MVGRASNYSPINASHTERAVFGNWPMLPELASVCANVHTGKSTKIAKPAVNVGLRPDSLTYLFTCGIVIRILFGRILNFYNRN